MRGGQPFRQTSSATLPYTGRALLVPYCGEPYAIKSRTIKKSSTRHRKGSGLRFTCSANLRFMPCSSSPQNHRFWEPYSIQSRTIKKSSTVLLLSRTNKTIIRGATLIHHIRCALQDTDISMATDVCPTLQNTLRVIITSHLTAPSAVHLTTCILPVSQPHGLSVKSCVVFISASTV